MPVTTDALIDQEITKRLANQNASVRETLIKVKVDEELSRRKTLAIKTLAKITELRKQFADMKQDAMFDDEGKPLLIGWSAAQNAIRGGIRDRIDNLEKALTDALGEKADWTALEKLIVQERL